jgi:hypothetical protein
MQQQTYFIDLIQDTLDQTYQNLLTTPCELDSSKNIYASSSTKVISCGIESNQDLLLTKSNQYLLSTSLDQENQDLLLTGLSQDLSLTGLSQDLSLTDLGQDNPDLLLDGLDQDSLLTDLTGLSEENQDLLLTGLSEENQDLLLAGLHQDLLLTDLGQENQDLLLTDLGQETPDLLLTRPNQDLLLTDLGQENQDLLSSTGLNQENQNFLNQQPSSHVCFGTFFEHPHDLLILHRTPPAGRTWDPVKSANFPDPRSIQKNMQFVQYFGKNYKVRRVIREKYTACSIHRRQHKKCPLDCMNERDPRKKFKKIKKVKKNIYKI